ncbi:MAG: RuBisCO large subunit C-terminal-like domain-containing protein [Nitrospira sp.]|nr:RuBisCO large subunit C-terminal-like domain-containing protein [Nitrospira sp.]MDH4305065.1 RuBisCO large subunit C-terminal-like domain-containing protein [Nitrospira sp.]MDH5193992.1 RuBisCO large subunit C-terminal-like domain-containing protein [Nitrospira sp.]
MNGERSNKVEFLTAIYEIDGPASSAQKTAERICFDQTIEAEDGLLPPSLQSEIVGQIENLQEAAGGRYKATIRFRGDLLSGDCTDLLNVLFGTSSLRGDVRLLSFTMTDRLLSSWRGPRFGMDVIRQILAVPKRPLLCGVLKPLGRSAQELAELAAQMVEGEIDLIKDDQNLVGQHWCPFEERVSRCADTIGDMSRRRGRPCLYFAHVSGAPDSMRKRAARAKALGATGLLVAPSLTGFDALRFLSSDEGPHLPIMSHPAGLGASVGSERGGLAPAVVYGLLPRLVGGDLTIYPAFGSGYPMSQRDCLSVALRCRESWGTLRPTMPAVGGRIGAERLSELGSALGADLACIVGSRIQKDLDGIQAALTRLHRAIHEWGSQSG